MKKMLFVSLAFIMAVSVFSMPSVSAVFADTADGDVVSTGGEQSLSEEAGSESDYGLQSAVVTFDKDQYSYTGNAVQPVPDVSVNGSKLVKDVDYSLEYSKNINVGKAEVKITGKGKYAGQITKSEFLITAADISKAGISMTYKYYDYNGKARTPVFKVTFNKKTLKKGTDYTVQCSNNVYPGKKTFFINGINNFTSSKTGTFYIANVSGFSVKKTGTDNITFKWNNEPNVTGYEIMKYNLSESRWEHVIYLKNDDTPYYTLKDLKSGLGAKYRIRSYVKDSDGKRHYGEWSSVLKAATRPGKVAVTKLTTNVKLQIMVKWGKKTSSGYQIRVSRNSDFSNASNFKISSSGTLSKTVKAAKDKHVYYVKVRAYKTYGGKTLYGSWSDSKSIKTDGNGWGTFDGKKYYYRGGKPLKGQYTINGNEYYFSKDQGGALLGTTYTMWKKVRNEASGTKYLIAVSKSMHKTCVYYRKNGRWVLKYYWGCSTGTAENRTPSGEFTVPKTKTHLKRFGLEKGYSCWYATRFYKSYYFHSIPYYPLSTTRPLDSRIGYDISHGCIRLLKDNAYWIYKNVDAGTKVIIY